MNQIVGGGSRRNLGGKDFMKDTNFYIQRLDRNITSTVGGASRRKLGEEEYS